MAQSFISEIGDRLGYDGVANTNGEHVKTISAEYFKKIDNGVVTNVRIQDAIASTEGGKVVATDQSSVNSEFKLLATASASPTSGAMTEAVYDTGITMNPSTNTIAANISGNAATATKANYLTGFTARSDSINWGTLTTSNGYKCVTDLQYKEGNQDTGDIAFGYKAGSGSSVYELSCQIDGYFYQRTGQKRVMDVADINSSFYAPTSAGTSGQLLKSSGSGAPTWAADSVSASIFSEKIGTPSSHPAIGSAYTPVFVNSNGGVEECAYTSWDQIRNDIGYDALEPRFVKSSASGRFPAMTAGDAFYFRIDAHTSIGARYFFGCEFNNLPCHISLRANLFSYGYPVVVVDEVAGYNGGDYGIRDVIVRKESASGKYELYIKVVSNVTKAADQLRWCLGSTQTTTSATLYTSDEYDALTTEVLFTVRARYYSLAVSNKLFYRDKVMSFGSGGSSSTPVFVNSDGEVKPCGDLTAEYANKVNRQNMEANASYTVPVIDGNGVVRTDTGTPQKLNYTSADNKLNVNIGGSSESTNKLIPLNMTSSATYRVPVMDSDGKVYKDSDQSDPKLTYKLSTNMLHTNIDGRSASTDSLIPQTFSNGTSKIVAAYDSSTGKVYNGPAVEKNNGVYKVYADITGNAATATNASSVNGMKIVRGAYGGVANTIYFC